MSKRIALQELLIDKENFESYIDDTLAHKLTDEEWDNICDALEHAVAEYVDNELYHLAEEYKYEKGIQ
jgi:hypothetical protein